MRDGMKMNLRIVSENEDELLCFCPFHVETKPSFIISKKGKYAGWGKCFGCGKFVSAKSLGLNMKVERIKKSKVNVNWNCILKNSISPNTIFWLNYLAIEWNVDINVLRSFNVIWDTTQRISSYFIPVYNENGIIIGIQKRYPDGQKIMIKGSKLGIFASSAILQGVGLLKNNPTLLVCEGLSDSVVATYLGFNAIGRISCTSSTDVITKFVKRLLTKGLKQVIIIADADDVGTTGADKLHKKLSKLVNCDILCPLVGKDLREYYNHCGYSTTKNWIKEKINEYKL